MNLWSHWDLTALLMLGDLWMSSGVPTEPWSQTSKTFVEASFPICRLLDLLLLDVFSGSIPPLALLFSSRPKRVQTFRYTSGHSPLLSSDRSAFVVKWKFLYSLVLLCPPLIRLSSSQAHYSSVEFNSDSLVDVMHAFVWISHACLG